MSEAEKKRRLEYKQNRKKWIIIQAIAILLVSILLLSTVIIYRQLNKTYYIDYTENGSTYHSVSLKSNEFFEDNTLDNTHGYVAELVDKVYAGFNYSLSMNASAMKYEHSHYVEATVKIVDDRTDTVIYQPTETLLKKAVSQTNESDLYILETVTVDYDKYNEMAKSFIETYKLSDVTSTLVLTMHVNVTGNCSAFENTAHQAYSTQLMIPLNEPVIKISSSSSPSEESKVLACKSDGNPLPFFILSIIFGIADMLLIALVCVFVYLTRNEDINYEIKVKRLVNSYRSYIQKLVNAFDEEGYQILVLGSFNEMLAIRDTIQSPILMSENEDKTCTRFLIPTNTKILYTFEIKVDDYDRIYAEPEPVQEEPQEPETELVEDVNDTELADALATPDIDLMKIDYVPDEDEELDEGIEVIGVVWPEKSRANKVYRYDPNGERVERGDIVLVPTKDRAKNKDVIRKAAVAHANHKVDPDVLHSPLKKIIGVVKRGLTSHL